MRLGETLRLVGIVQYAVWGLGSGGAAWAQPIATPPGAPISSEAPPGPDQPDAAAGAAAAGNPAPDATAGPAEDEDAAIDALLAIDPAAPLDPIPGMEVSWPEGSDVPDWPGAYAAEDAATPDEQADGDAATAAAEARDGIDRAALTPPDEALSTEASTVADDTGEGRAADRAARRAGRSADDDTDRAARRARNQAVRDLRGREVDYDVTLDFVGDAPLQGVTRDAFEERFRSLSALQSLDDDPANIAQLNRRARQDRDLIDQLLRVYGHYDGLVDQSVDRAPTGERLLVGFSVTPGPGYHLSAIDLPGLGATGTDQPLMRAAFGLAVGDPINADQITLGTGKLASALLENGYTFSALGEPELLIDHQARGGALTLAVMPGGKYRFGAILTDPDPLLSARHLQRIARFDPGDIYRQSRIEDLRRAILATGLVSSVTITPVAEPGAPARTDGTGTVDVKVDTVAAPLRTIAGELGYGTGEGYRAEVSWEHRNFFPPEGLVRVRAVGGTQEQLLGFTYRRNNFRKRDQVLTAQILASNVNRAAFDARTFLVSGTLERQTNLIFQKTWVWSVGAELALTDERDSRLRDVGLGRQTFYITALPTALTYDGSDDLLDPTSGFRLGGRLSPELSFESGTNIYARAQLDGSYYRPVSDRVVLAGRVRLGSIVGAEAREIAPSRRFYAGGGGSVRGYGYQQIGNRNINGDPIGGRSLAEFSLEARVRFGAFGVVPFVDAGNVYAGEAPDFTGLRVGAGLGLRYYSSFGPLRLDIGTPINPRAGDSAIAVYISLGQAF